MNLKEDNSNEFNDMDIDNIEEEYKNEMINMLNKNVVNDEVIEEKLFIWKIDDWEQLNKEKAYSPTFKVGGYTWRILLFKEGNNNSNYIAVFLDNVDAKDTENPPTPDWHVCANFVLSIRNYEDPAFFQAKASYHRFNTKESDWGFNNFLEISHLYLNNVTTGQSLLEENKTVLTVYVRVYKDINGILWHDFINWDSKKETGYVGFKNQGATCYMNSLLQALYFTNYFRKATYQIPTENDEPTKSIPLALQRVFYNLQNSNQSVDTRELTKSFGWDTMESFMQHDVQEFNRELQDNLENKMKGTEAEGAISKLFKGRMRSYIECINIDYTSSRVEEYYDIQLNVKGCKDLYDSFDEYIKVETLEGENQYMAEGHGLQDAQKGVIFESLPPVLQLQLKRFEYNVESDSMVKINDRFEFQEKIDLTKYLSKDADQSIKYVYHLHSVLVHSGYINGGHYCAFIHPKCDGKWFKFDDDRVVPVNTDSVFEENFGGTIQPVENKNNNGKIQKRYTNAYMLAYIREDDISTVLAPIQDEDIPAHLTQRIENERKEKEKREKEKREQHLYIIIMVMTDETIRENSGRFDLCNIDDKQYPQSKLKEFKCLKTETIADFQERVANEYEIDERNIRFWNVVKRQNRTKRPELPFEIRDDKMTLEEILSTNKPIQKEDYNKYLVYMEVSEKPFVPATKTTNFIIFIKYFDQYTRKMEYLGSHIVKSNDEIFSDLVPVLNEMKGFPPDTKLQLYEEIKPDMIDKIVQKFTFEKAEIGNGDIICFQRKLTEEDLEKFKMNQSRIIDIPKYFDYVRKKVLLTFKLRVEKKEDEHYVPVSNEFAEFKLELLKDMDYDMIAKTVAAHLKLENPLNLRFYLENSKKFIERNNNSKLSFLLNDCYFTSSPNILYYEIQDIPITEFDKKKFVKVKFLNKFHQEQKTYKLLVMKNATVKELLDELKKKVTLESGSGELRLLNIVKGRIECVYSNDINILQFNDYMDLYAEEIPEDQINLDLEENTITVIHYKQDLSRYHSIPFIFTLIKDEEFGETKKRLQKSLGMNDRDFSKIKITVITNNSIHNFDNNKNDLILFNGNKTNINYIGLDYVNKSIKINKSSNLEKAVKILN